MFGFGKKTEKNDYQKTQTLAMEILELYHKTVEHELEDIDNYFKEN